MKEDRCPADAPKIDRVSTVMPGYEFVILGKGLGASGGAVDLMTGGRIFPARITDWDACEVDAQVGDNIEGLKADSQAMIVLKTSTGKETRGVVSFQPLREAIVRWEDGSCRDSWCFGESCDYTFFNNVLKNDWYVYDTSLWASLEQSKDEHAEITFAPPNNVPNIRTVTYAHAGDRACYTAYIAVFQTLVGPKGLQPF